MSELCFPINIIAGLEKGKFTFLKQASALHGFIVKGGLVTLTICTKFALDKISHTTDNLPNLTIIRL